MTAGELPAERAVDGPRSGRRGIAARERLLRYINDEHETASAFFLAVVIRHMVVDMTVEKPLAGLPSLPDHVVSFAGRDVDRVLH